MTKNVCVIVDPSVAKEENSKRFLLSSLQEVGFKKEQIAFLLSHDKLGDAPKADYLKQYAEEALLPELRKGNFELIIPFGNNAICSLGLTPKPTGITKFRGKKAYCPEEHGIKTVAIATCSVHAVMNTPQTQDSYYQDLTYAFKTLNGEILQEQEELDIVRLYEPKDFELMFEETLDTTKQLAYDHETTGLDCLNDFVVTTCWYNGARTSTGACKGYAWAGYDQLKPLYSPTGLQEIKDVVSDILELAGEDYDLIGHNIAFDDWMSEGFIGREFNGSQFDTMLMKWTVNSQRPHGLKECTARYLGFPDYDGPMAPYLNAVKARRGKLLSVEEHAEDLWVLQNFFPDVEIEYKITKKTEKFRWPKEVDKGFAMYAMVPLDTLLQYNVYDAVYTFQLKQLFEKMIDEDNLWPTYNLRHEVNRRLWKQAEQRGLLLDVERNRNFSKQLEDINQRTLYQILQRTEAQGFDTFNPASPQHVAKALFGETGTVPVIARRAFYKKYGELATDKVCDKIEQELYGDMTEVKELIRANSFDWAEAQDELTEMFIDETNWSGHIPCMSKVIGLGGLGYDPVAVTKTGQPSTSKASLITLNKGKPSDLLSLILMYKRGTKIKKDFIDKIYDTSRADNTTSASYRVSGTETARISSSGKFNMQNFIKQLRGQFKARPGMTFITFDYSAVEVRVMAAFSQDELLKKDLLSEDIHRAIASKIYGKAPEDVTDNERTKAKTATFLILYGGGADKLAAAFNITRTEAQSIIDSLLKVYPGIKTWMDDVIANAALEPYYVYTALGTRRSVKNILSNDYKEVLHAQRQAVNSIIQGTAGELMLYKICQILNRAESKGWYDFFIAATVHDSATFEVSKKYAWNEPVLDDKGIPVLDKKGKPKLKPCGPGVDMVREVCAEPMEYAPIDTMTFPIDLQVDDYWDGEPNLTDALNGKTKEEEFRYDLIFDLQEEDEEEEELTV